MSFSFSNTTTSNPGQPIAVNTSSSLGAKPKTPMDVATKILIMVNVFAVVACGGLFEYQNYLKQQITQKKAQLISYTGNVAQLPLQDIQALSDKLATINPLVKNYPYVTDIFPILEASIENNVTYSSLNVAADSSAAGSGGYVITLQATAPDYKSVSRQITDLRSDVYKNYIKDVSISNISLSESGQVSFYVKLTLAIRGVAPDMLVLTAALSNTVNLLFSTTTATSTMVTSSSTLPLGGFGTSTTHSTSTTTASSTHI